MPPFLPARLSAIPQLDTVRMLAMLGIFLHHLWKTVIPVPQDAIQRVLDPAFSAASDSVILFNFISGFLLALPYLGPEQRPAIGYYFFLQKRFLRIIPPYYLALLLFTLANILRFGYPLAPAFNMLVQHLLFINALDYSNMFTNFSPFWYLSQLAQFYLLFPLVLGFFLRVGAVRATLSITSLCWGAWVFLAWYFPATPGAAPEFPEYLMHFNLPGRLPEFALGMWLASLWNPSAVPLRRSIFNKAFLSFALAMTLYLIAGTPFYPVMSLPFIHIYHVALSLILFLLLLLWNPAAKAGESALVKNLATRSYSIYIVHHPLFSYVGVTPATVAHTLGNFAILTILLLPLSYLAALVLDFFSAAIVRRFPVKEKRPS